MSWFMFVIPYVHNCYMFYTPNCMQYGIIHMWNHDIKMVLIYTPKYHAQCDLLFDSWKIVFCKIKLPKLLKQVFHEIKNWTLWTLGKYGSPTRTNYKGGFQAVRTVTPKGFPVICFALTWSSASLRVRLELPWTMMITKVSLLKVFKI